MDGCPRLCALLCSPNLSLILSYFSIFALFSILGICPYLCQRILYRGRSQQMGRPFTSSKNNLQGDQNHEKIPVQFEGRATYVTKNLMSSIPQGVPSILSKNLHKRRGIAFSSLISFIHNFPTRLPSALSEYPEVYEVASVAAASLPTTYVDFSIQSNTKLVDEALEKEASICSCTSFIVLTTVVAASAWWRDHGLLPSRFEPNLAFTQAIARALESAKVHEDNTNLKEKVGQTHQQKAPQIDFPEENETNKTQPCSALLELSSSPDSCESSKMNRPPKSTNYFVSLLASVLPLDPVICQAASVAAASLPPTYVDFSIQSNTILVGEALEKESSISSCTSAIVLATIDAAASWWRDHGLLPSQFQSNHAFTQPMAQAIESAQLHEDNTISKEKVGQTHKQKAPQIDFPEENEINRITQPCSALLEFSSSPDSCESSKMNRPPKSTRCALSSICGMHDENHVPGKKKYDPSSCDSNTTPSSEVEKDAGLNKKEVKGVNEQGEQGPSIVQELRDTPGNIKSCTEDLKQCPQALEGLLSRVALPRSLSPPHQDGNLAVNFGNEEAIGLQIVLNTKASTTTCQNFQSKRAQICSKMGSEIATFKRLFVDTEEKKNTGQEEGS